MFNKKKEPISTCSLWSEIIFQVQQGSILGLLLLNVFLCDISQFPPDLDIANYTNDNTLLSSKLNLNEIWRDLEKRIKHFALMTHRKPSEGNPGKITSSYELITKDSN